MKLPMLQAKFWPNAVILADVCERELTWTGQLMLIGVVVARGSLLEEKSSKKPEVETWKNQLLVAKIRESWLKMTLKMPYKRVTTSHSLSYARLHRAGSPEPQTS